MLARQIDVYAEMDRFLDEQWPKSRGRGEMLYEVFGGRESTGMSQMRNLQNIVVTAPRFYDIADYIKNQMGKEAEPDKRPDRKSTRYWTRTINGALLGTLLLNDLDALLDKAHELAESYPESDPYNLALYLARGWIRQIMAEYLYQRALQEE